MKYEKVKNSYEIDVVMEMAMLVNDHMATIDNIAQETCGDIEVFDDDVKSIIIMLSNDYLENHDDDTMSKLECMRAYFSNRFSAIVEMYFVGE